MRFSAEGCDAFARPIGVIAFQALGAGLGPAFVALGALQAFS
jgi:hypothetical protein